MIFTETTYRGILQKELGRRMEINPLFSANSFSRKLGISQSYFSLIMRGKRELSETSAKKIADKLGFNADEKNYFNMVVKKDAAKDKDVCSYYENKITEFKKKKNVDELSLKNFEVISDWHYSALLECLNLVDIEHTTQGYASRLNLNVEVVQECLELLNALGLVTKKGKRWIRKDSGAIFTPNEIKSQGLRKFHKQILKKAAIALDEQPLENRNISGITMAIDPKKIPEAKIKIQNFMNDLMEFLEDGERTEIYQLNTILINLRNEEKSI